MGTGRAGRVLLFLQFENNSADSVGIGAESPDPSFGYAIEKELTESRFLSFRCWYVCAADSNISMHYAMTPSLDSIAKSLDSIGSLGEFGEPDPDPTKFTEDGSFIGQYSF